MTVADLTLLEKSIPQTRLRFQKQMVGLEEMSEPQWEDEKEGESWLDLVKIEGPDGTRSGKQADKGGGSGSGGKRKASGKS